MYKARILCVDDNPADLKLHSRILRNAGYQVFCASDTRESMQIFMREQLDLVLLDFSLGDTDGGILAFEMRRRRPGVRIAYLCGDPSKQMPLNAVIAVIEKSADRTKFEAEVRRVLEMPFKSVA